MFEGFSQQTIDFMWNLRFNNNKVWFEENKETYLKHFLGPMKALGSDVFDSISADFKDHDFIHKTSRIYKDARRVRGGEPYRTNLWFCIERPSGEWTATPVFWFELGPENWSYGLGYYQAKAATMAKLRARIDKNPKAFEKLTTPFNKQNEFVLSGEEYARKKEAPTEKSQAWYNKKSFSMICENPNSEELFSPELKNLIAEGFKFLMPLYDYFITLDTDPTPEKLEK